VTEQPDPPEGVATQAPPGITCVLLMGAFFTTAWGLRVLFSRLGPRDPG